MLHSKIVFLIKILLIFITYKTVYAESFCKFNYISSKQDHLNTNDKEDGNKTLLNVVKETSRIVIQLKTKETSRKKLIPKLPKFPEKYESISDIEHEITNQYYIGNPMKEANDLKPELAYTKSLECELGFHQQKNQYLSISNHTESILLP